MAKISVDFDTVEKTMVVKHDGKVLKNVNGLSMYCGYEGKHSCDIMMSEHDEESGVTMYQRLSASDSNEAKEAIKNGAKEDPKLPGFVKTDSKPECLEKISAFLTDYMQRS